MKAFRNVAVIVVAIFTVYFLVYHTDDEEESIEEQVAGLMACVVTETCTSPTTEENVQGVKFLGVYHKMPEKNANIKYLVGNGLVMVIVVTNNGNDQVTLADVDLDGEIDTVGLIKDGKVTPLGTADSGPWQRIYDSSMRIAWKEVIPENIKRELIRTRGLPLEKVLPKEQPEPNPSFQKKPPIKA